ncbi:hypothetical protein E4T56_gene2502 [Termitomyces sp. T112]|nr:hypothetical protein E4T56_gene2502 [Termitomyces sp. T112]
MATSPSSLAAAIPDADTLTNAAKLQILDSQGAKVTFGSLFENQKTIVVFISENLYGLPIINSFSIFRALLLWREPPFMLNLNTPDLNILATSRIARYSRFSLNNIFSANTIGHSHVKLAVVGCGDWQPIQSYANTTKFSGPIYADPSRSLYRALGMNIEKLEGTPPVQQRKSYLTTGPLKNAMKSIWKGPLKHPNLLGKQGNISQLGGDFVLGPGLICSFAWRMQHTEDHVEIAELLEKAGVEYS